MPAKGIFKKKHTQKNLKELKLKLKSCIKKVKSYIKLYKKVKKKTMKRSQFFTWSGSNKRKCA